MSKQNNILLYIRYPYTAVIIATVWLGLAFLLPTFMDYFLLLVISATVVTVIVAFLGFKPKK